MFRSNITFDSEPFDWRTASRAAVETEFLTIVGSQHCCYCSPEDCQPRLPIGDCGQHFDEE